MSTVQVAVRLDSRQNELFRSITKQLGITPADALRMFVHTFNACGGFPYSVRIGKHPVAEPFATEEEALDFTARMASKLLKDVDADETR